MSNLWLNVKQAFRSLLRAPAFTLTAMLTLALGIGATTAMFATLRAALWKPLPFKDSARLVLPKTTFNGRENDFTSAPDFFDYREQAGCFEHLAALQGPEPVTVTGERAEKIPATLVSPDFFQMLGIAPVAGRWFSPEESAPGGPVVVVVSEGYARRRFGSPQDALGKSLMVAALNLSVPIVGVASADLNVFSITDLWVPARKGDPVINDTRGAHNWFLFGRLKTGVSMGSAQQQVDAIARSLEAQYPDTNKNAGLKINPLQEALVGDQRPQLAMLMGAVVLLLLIACGNVAGLMLARGISRRSELAVRASMGASRGRLVLQLLTESVLLSCLAGLAGIVLAHFLLQALPVVSGLADQGVPPGTLDIPVLAFATAVSLLTGVVFGLVPALKAASENLAQDLAPGRRMAGGKAGTRLRSCMVVAQVALSLVLLVGSGMLMRSILKLNATPLGFDTRSLLAAEIEISDAKYMGPERQSRFFEDLQERLRATPGVKDVGFVSHIPLKHTHGNWGVWTPEHPPTSKSLDSIATADRRLVLPGYFKTMGIPLLAGRDIAPSDGPKASPVMVISERMARTLFPDRNPLGQAVLVDNLDTAGGPPYAFQVVGVAGNARIDFISIETRPVMYLSFSQTRGTTRMNAMIRTSLAPEAMAQTVRQQVQAMDRDVPLDRLPTMEQLIDTRLAPRKVTAATLALFSVVALLLASLGLYGVLSFLVGQRTREIGVRTALGAQISQVVWEIVRHGLLLTAIGMGLGVVGSLVMGRILAGQLYQVSPADPVSMALASLALGLVALLAALIPALRAARVDPMVALRDE